MAPGGDAIVIEDDEGDGGGVQNEAEAGAAGGAATAEVPAAPLALPEKLDTLKVPELKEQLIWRDKKPAGIWLPCCRNPSPTPMRCWHPRIWLLRWFAHSTALWPAPRLRAHRRSDGARCRPWSVDGQCRRRAASAVGAVRRRCRRQGESRRGRALEAQNLSRRRARRPRHAAEPRWAARAARGRLGTRGPNAAPARSGRGMAMGAARWTARAVRRCSSRIKIVFMNGYPRQEYTPIHTAHDKSCTPSAPCSYERVVGSLGLGARARAGE